MFSVDNQPNVGKLGKDHAKEAVKAGYWEGMKKRAVKK